MTDLPIEDNANEHVDYEADEFTSKDVDSDAYESTIDEEPEDEEEDEDDSDEDEDEEQQLNGKA